MLCFLSPLHGAKGPLQFSLAGNFITVLWCKDFDTCFGDVTFWIMISKAGIFWSFYRVCRRKEAVVKALGGKEFGYEGKKLFVGLGIINPRRFQGN